MGKEKQKHAKREFAVITVRTPSAKPQAKTIGSTTSSSFNFQDQLETNKYTQNKKRTSRNPDLSSMTSIDGTSHRSRIASSLLSNRSSRTANPFDTVTGITTSSSDILLVYYPAECIWRKMIFPPGVTVGQARDLCMLKFNVWSHITEKENSSPASFSLSSGDIDGISIDTGKDTNLSHTSIRDKFGLYWAARSRWLDNHVMLNSYQFSSRDTLELQNKTSFIATPEMQRNLGTCTAEGYMFYLETKGIKSTWVERWLVLERQTLYCYKAQGTKKPLIEIDLTSHFKILDQNGQANQKVAPSDKLSNASSNKGSRSCSSQSVGMSGIMGHIATSRGGALGGDGAPLIIQSGWQVHVFCTKNAVDYDHWRRTLQMIQSAFGNDSEGTISSFSYSQNSYQKTDSVREKQSTPSSVSTTPPFRQHASKQSKFTSDSGFHSVGVQTIGIAEQYEEGADLELSESQEREQEHDQRPESSQESKLSQFIAIAYRKKSEVLGFQLCHCVVVKNKLYGFNEIDVCINLDDESLKSSSDFMVDLVPGCTGASPEMLRDRHIIRILGIDSTQFTDLSKSRAPSKESDTDVDEPADQCVELLCLEIGSADKKARWVDALCNIGGIQVVSPSGCELINPLQAQDNDYTEVDQELQELTLRRSRSFISSISRAEWPLPPSTIPKETKWGTGASALAPNDRYVYRNTHLNSVGLKADDNVASSFVSSSHSTVKNEAISVLSRLGWFGKRRESNLD